MRAAKTSTSPSLAYLARQIAWDQLATELSAGDLTSLDAVVADLIRQAAGQARVCEAAEYFGLSAEQIVIGLLARSVAARNRFAARVERAFFGTVEGFDFEPLCALLGIPHVVPAALQAKGT